MFFRDESFKTRYNHWKRWRATNTNSIFYQLAVLLGILRSPTFETMFVRVYFRKK